MVELSEPSTFAEAAMSKSGNYIGTTKRNSIVGIGVPTYPDGQEKNLRGREFDSNPFSILFLLECEIGREKLEGLLAFRI